MLFFLTISVSFFPPSSILFIKTTSWWSRSLGFLQLKWKKGTG
ncbi:hypothetical protein V6Z11_D06G045000 [Gossypium hirsutum]